MVVKELRFGFFRLGIVESLIRVGFGVDLDFGLEFSLGIGWGFRVG